MKKIIMTTVLFVAIITVFANGLNSNANAIEEAMPEVYTTINSMAVSKWGADYDMVVYTINNESDSYVKVLNFYNANRDNDAMMKILDSALLKGSEFKSGDEYPLITGHAQWGMVESTINKQVKSYSALNGI